ncbi:MAG: hypothetical protein AAGA23_22165 [Pseudomonadota bacterium]
MSNDADPRLTQWLAQLPEHDPPPQIWMRVLETRLAEQSTRTRRSRLIAGGALAATLAMSIALGLVLTQQPTPAQPPTVTIQAVPQLAALMRRTEQLEQALRQQQEHFVQLASTQQQLVRSQQAQLIALDQALADAYARNLPEAQLARLWQRRVDLMADLVSIYDTAPGAGSI